MAKVSYYTQEGYRNVERPRVIAAIAEARDKGDLSENAEYDAAKEAQGMLEMRIAKMEETLANARVMDASQLDNSKVLILSTVRIRNVQNKRETRYTLVAQNEADIAKGKISVDSPIGKGLLGKAVGDIAEIKVPNGIMNFEILEITRDKTYYSNTFKYIYHGIGIFSYHKR